jgi:hypothetical protein
MRKSRFMEEQIIKVLKETLPGCRRPICTANTPSAMRPFQVAVSIWRDGDLRAAQAEGAGG